jgi:hypothetical protein
MAAPSLPKTAARPLHVVAVPAVDIADPVDTALVLAKRYKAVLSRWMSEGQQLSRWGKEAAREVSIDETASPCTLCYYRDIDSPSRKRLY